MSKKTLDLEDVDGGSAGEAVGGRKAAGGEAGQELAPSGREVAGGRQLLGGLGAISDVPVQLAAVLGRASMPVSQLLRLGRGAVVELDRKVGEPIDIYVNNRLVARGEVMIVDDHLGVTMTEIIKGDG
jgi:flagellar motor switch protein FliN